MGIYFTLKIGYQYDISDNCDTPCMHFLQVAEFDLSNLRELRDIMKDGDDYCGHKILSVDEAITWLESKERAQQNYVYALACLKIAQKLDIQPLVKVIWG